MPSFFTRERILFYCTALLVSGLLLQIFALVNGRQIGGDFAAFYGEGKVALKYPHGELYNIDLQQTEYSAITGTQETSPFPYPPWFTIPLAALARLPFLPAFLIWTLVSIGFLIAGFLFIASAVKLPRSSRPLGALACLAFPPYLFYTLINGQPAAFAFFILALAYFLQDCKWQLLAGITLSLLTYKPTLIVFVGPMLLLTRQWRTLFGLAIGAAALAVISYLWAGVDGYRGFFRLMQLFAQATNSRVEIFQTYKYINIGAAVRLLFGPQPKLQLALVLIGFPLACVLWYRLGRSPLSWSIAVVLGLLLSMYSPIYDSTVVIFAVMIIGVATLDSWLIGALYLVSMITVPVAQVTGIQLYTLVLLTFLVVLVKRTPGFGYWIEQLRQAFRRLFQRADPQQLLASEQCPSASKD